MTIFLRFPSEAAFRLLLDPSFQRDGETGAPLPAGITAISIIGEVYKNSILLSGFHVNALGKLPVGWGIYQINPTTPSRVFG